MEFDFSTEKCHKNIKDFFGKLINVYQKKNCISGNFGI